MLTRNNTLKELEQGVLKFGPELLDCCETSEDLTQYFARLEQEHLDYPRPVSEVNSAEWFIPYKYQTMDIEQYLVDQCPEDNYSRLVEELALYQQHNMMPVLRCIKYVVDTLRDNSVVWGVGRGSSVASYVLYLLGAHRIDSVKYNLPLEEFFK